MNSIVRKIANKKVKWRRGFDKPYTQKMPRLLLERNQGNLRNSSFMLRSMAKKSKLEWEKQDASQTVFTLILYELFSVEDFEVEVASILLVLIQRLINSFSFLPEKIQSDCTVFSSLIFCFKFCWSSWMNATHCAVQKHHKTGLNVRPLGAP